VHASPLVVLPLLLASASALAAEKPESDHTLLSTAALTREIHSLQGPREWGPKEKEPSALKSRVARMRYHIGTFVTRQIEAYPSISECALQKQLASAFEIEDDCSGPPEREAPRVFAQSWGPKSTRRVFVLTYLWFGFYGKGGSETILESYVWERDHGVHRGAGMVPAALSGLLTQAEDVSWFPNPDRTWVLISGTVGGGSGRVLGGSAAVFEIGPEQTKTIWTAPPSIGNLRAYTPPWSLRWEIEYADVKRFYEGLPNAELLDIYQIDYPTQTFRRLVHQPLDPRR
jgi:hypothetical protein